MPAALDLILASASPRRRELLERLGLPFRIETSNAAEISSRHHGHLTPTEICLANATAKARVVAAGFPENLVLGADTEVALGTRVFGKPGSREEAGRFLRELSGKTHQVITGICLLRHRRPLRRSFTVVTHVTFHPLSDADIARYLDAVPTLDKAGAYAVQQHGDWIIEHLDGSLSNVIGLPLAALREALSDLLANPAGRGKSPSLA